MKKNIPAVLSSEEQLTIALADAQKQMTEYAIKKGLTAVEFAAEAEESLRNGEISKFLNNHVSGKELMKVLPQDFVNLANSFQQD